VVDQLVGHAGGINVVDGFYFHKQQTLLASASSDSSVKIWFRENYEKNFGLLQTVLCKSKGFALALK
jgi:hypothetical protein